MKKLSILLLTVVLVFILSACNMASGGGVVSNGQQTPNSSDMTSSATSITPLTDATPKLTREQALEIALNKVGATAAQIADLDVDLDYESGVLVYEIDFDFGDKEFSFDIDANSGKIIYQDSEKRD